jgi:hypothetical protein
LHKPISRDFVDSDLDAQGRFCRRLLGSFELWRSKPRSILCNQAAAPPIQEAWQTNPSLRGYLLRATFFNSVNPQVHYERYLETYFAQEKIII